MQNATKRLFVWAAGIALLLVIPLVLTLLGSGVDGNGWHWTLSDFVIAGGALFSVGLVYEVLAKRSEKTAYRAALGFGLLGALLLGWVSGAVGIIGSENNPANLMYWGVPVVLLVGSLISRFKPRGMAYTLSAAALVQLLVPMFALFIWPAQASWGEAGVIGVFIFNSIFAVLFAISALLFWRVALSEV